MIRNNTVVIIPAYQPTDELISLVKELTKKDFADLIVIDDGSGDDYSPIFRKISRDVIYLKHHENMGKGSALKTGFAFVKELYTSGTNVITCDADGQHRPEDICKVRDAMHNEYSESAIILGSRLFDKDVPLRSSFGNTITRNVFGISSGVKLRDTQTGLRGITYDLLKFMLSISGDRYEYEMNMLLEASKRDINIAEIDIETVYIENNQSSHFRVLRDSFIIYKNIISFSLSSILCAGIDFLIVFVLSMITVTLNPAVSLMIAVVGARIVSSLINYNINKRLVFGRGSDHSFVKYYSLVLTILSLNYSMMYLLSIIIGFPVLISKILTEVTLFTVSYLIQKELIFTNRRRFYKKRGLKQI